MGVSAGILLRHHWTLQTRKQDSTQRREDAKAQRGKAATKAEIKPQMNADERRWTQMKTMVDCDSGIEAPNGGWLQRFCLGFIVEKSS